MGMIGIIHNYSRTNPGCSELTDLTLQRLSRIGATRDDVVLVALHPESFPEFPRRVKIGARGRSLAPEILPATRRAIALSASALTRRSVGQLGRELAKCDALVAVGGGYLRAVDLVSSVGTVLNQLPQLLFAGRAEVPSLYFPQTIGPLRGPVGRAVRRGLQSVDAVCVRDPWSEADLDGLPNVHRIPDLVVLQVADHWDEIEKVDSAGHVAISARQVHHVSDYEHRLLSVARDLGDRAVWAVHATGHPARSDAVHYERLGITPDGGLVEMLQRRELSVVVSVRLHGALMAIATGVPAIHLAYDRKGAGAFDDLGLQEWCFDVRSFDPVTLKTAVDNLMTDPQPYWDRVAKQVPGLQTASAELDALVSSTLGQ
jgi:polysaccharide pyruvyl transferase WcaK-like protein